MSLMSLISNSSTASTTTSSSSNVAASIKAMLESKSTAAATTTATASSASSSGVNISPAAKIAAAEVADNKKDFAALTKDVRAALDEQKASTPDLSEMSGRALAAIALNKGGDFSGREVAAAKAELRERTRDQFSATVGGSATLSGLAAYNQQLVSQYDAMSAEEREALGWTDKVRTNAEAFVSASTTTTSLFDQLDGTDDSAF